MKNPIVINGGGIAGLTTALCLAKYGFPVEVHEKAQNISEVGAGIQISPNAFSVLEMLRVGRQIRQFGNLPHHISIRKSSNGKEITKVPLGLRAIKRYGFPYVVIHRADLHDILLHKCAESRLINVKLGSEIVDFAVHQNGITTSVFSDGRIQEDRAQSLIVADGVNSKFRTNIMGLEKPVFQQKIAWRALIQAEAVPSTISMENTSVWLSRGAHAVAYPIRDGKFLNVIAITKATNPRIAKNVDKENIAEVFKSWAPEFKSLFENNALWSGWPIYESQFSEKMSKGPVAIIGDAAHAMLPFAAQGAAMAIEDASVLARNYATYDNSELAFEKYAKERVMRLRDVKNAARKNGRIYHMGGPAAFARNTALRLSPQALLLARQDWVYNWRPQPL